MSKSPTPQVTVSQVPWHGIPTWVAEFSVRGRRFWRSGASEAEALAAIAPVFENQTNSKRSPK
jgi:hypothetical protein